MLKYENTLYWIACVTYNYVRQHLIYKNTFKQHVFLHFTDV